jgi:N-acyl-D-amino-acid deacylase
VIDMLDIAVIGGEVIDGTGSTRFAADVGVKDGRIVAVASLGSAPARTRIDARGQVVAPGFIDVHTHDDHELLSPPSAGVHPKLSQGVTTVVTGNCGISLAPLVTTRPPAPLDILGPQGWRFERFADYLDALDAAGPIVNAACLVGHTTLRVRHVADLSRAASAAECDRMAADLEAALDAGAFGLSTGVYYPPARAATAQELAAVGAPLGKGSQASVSRAVMAVHLRDEGDAIDAAMDEALEVGRSVGAATLLSHHKLVGRSNHGRSAHTLARLREANRIQPVCADCYPYDASSTMLLAARVAQSREVIVTWSEAEPAVAGRSLFELAGERGMEAGELATRLQPAGAIYFAMDEADVSRVLADELTMIGSDGLAHDTWPHPRLWGTFPRVLGRYVRERQLLSLEAAVHKMTGQPAAFFGLAGRGRVAEGACADLTVFDPQAVADRATYAEPRLSCDGIGTVIVNGRLAFDTRRIVDAHAGVALRRGRCELGLALR